MDTKHGLLNLVDNLVVEGGADFHRALVQSEFLAVISNVGHKVTLTFIFLIQLDSSQKNHQTSSRVLE